MAEEVVGFRKSTAGRIMAMTEAAERQGPPAPQPAPSGPRPASPGFWARVIPRSWINGSDTRPFYTDEDGYAWELMVPNEARNGLVDASQPVRGEGLFEVNGNKDISAITILRVFPNGVTADGKPRFLGMQVMSFNGSLNDGDCLVWDADKGVWWRYRTVEVNVVMGITAGPGNTVAGVDYATVRIINKDPDGNTLTAWYDNWG
jgi:hypothetical protein